MIDDLSAKIGKSKACNGFGIPRSSYYYWKRKKTAKTTDIRCKFPGFAYTPVEKDGITKLINSEKYVDKTPYEIYASKLDEGEYLCSVRTMYRILKENNQVKERRDVRRRSNYEKPELLATRQNQIWTWDITKLKSDMKWTYYYLYVMIDIFSRYVVGWMVAYRELASLAEIFIKETTQKQGIVPKQLTIHADNGSSMKSKQVALLLSDLGITKSHSRPYVSNDNPYSESHFKTMKYRPEFPKHFYSMAEAKKFCRLFFNWYNKEHYHSGIGYLTPESVHYGYYDTILENRRQVLLKAYELNPKRLRFKKPNLKNLPKNVWINKPDNIENKKQ